ncbi:MAG: murein L,D-transpeptidase [Hyphomicrobiaceae bacterium]
MTDRKQVTDRSTATPSRRAALRRLARVAAGFGAVAASSGSAAAQCNWLENVFGAPCQQTAARGDQRLPKEQPVQNDLRTGNVPLRSEAMLQALDGAIQRYSQLAQKGGWPQIPGSRMIRPGDDDDRVPLVRRRLAATGELGRGLSGYDTFSFDGELEVAVRRFQDNHGLRPTGRVDRPTLAALNVPVQARIAQLKLNYQRLNELIGQRIEDRFIMVNVAGFQLEAVSQGNVDQRHRVIAGRSGRETPVVKAHIRALNFFPFWRVPDSVATLDLFPKLQKEPEYLQKEQIRVLANNFNGPELDASQIDWRQADATRIKFRQDPGPQNALGLVRIDMPNEHGVYMHDTPMKPLFAQAARAFSAGCVRVQDPFDLAAWIAREEPGMDRRRIDEILASGTAADITLARQIPVYFTYITAWVEQDGRVFFRPDVYGRDGLRELSGDRERDPDAGPPPTQVQALAP